MKVAIITIKYPSVELALEINLNNNPLVDLHLARNKGQAFEKTKKEAYEAIGALIPCISDYTKRMLEALSNDAFVKTRPDDFDRLSFSVKFVKGA